MQPGRVTRASLTLALVMVLQAALACPVRAVEPVREMIDALCARQMFDTALEYLESLRTSRLVADDVRKSVSYEQGVVWIRTASSTSDATLKEKYLQQAVRKLQEFIDAKTAVEMNAAANMQLANIVVEQGRIKVATARAQPENKSKLMAEARAIFSEAQKRFESAAQDLEAQLKQIPKLIPPEEVALRNRQSQLASDLVNAQMLNAGIDFELSTTAEPGGTEARRYLKSAADKYGKVYNTYRSREFGLQAHLWEGRCYQEMGDTQQATACFNELRELVVTDENKAAVEPLRNQATRYMIEMLTSTREKKFANAAAIGEKWVQENPQTKDAHPDVVAIRYFTGVAYYEDARTHGEKDPERRRLLANARPHLFQASRFPGDFQKNAKTMLAAIAPSRGGAPTDGLPSTFAEAMEVIKATIEQYQTAASELQTAEGGQDKDKIAEARSKKTQLAATAVGQLRHALNLADPKNDAEDLTQARYLLTFLYWDTEQLYDSAVMGEFLARNYTKTAPGRQSAVIAMWSWVKLNALSKSPDKSFEVAQVLRTAEFITTNWPGEEEAEQAFTNLLNFALQERQIAKALGYLAKIAEDSPRRGQAELRTGQTLWAAYLRGMQAPEAERPPKADLDGFKQKAQEVLEKGISRMEAGEVNLTLPAAALSLAQIYVDTGQVDKAIERLEHPKYGPLTLVAANSPITNVEQFPVETHKFALRAYVAKQELKKAEDEMNALEQLVAAKGDAKANETLTAVYIALGRELQQQLKLLGPEEAKNISKGFELFLTRIAQREKGNTYNSLAWVAETFYSLASGLDTKDKVATGDAQNYYQQALKTYERILSMANANPTFVPSPENVLGLRLRMAMCQRRVGNFSAAIKTLSAILKERPTMLTIQIEAASTYQSQGAVDHKAYANAILGGEPDGKGQNIIWGWARLSKATMNNPKFEDEFHLARCNLAEARYLYGLTFTDAAKRNQYAQAAKQDIRLTLKLYPNMGGKVSYDRYERLLRDIQKSLGEKVVGMAEFAADVPPTTAAAN